MRQDEGLRLSSLRRARGLTQQEVSELLAAARPGLTPGIRPAKASTLGANAQMVSKWERGEKRPSPIYRKLYCEIFGIDYFSLWSEPDSPNEEAGTHRRDFLKITAASVLAKLDPAEESTVRIVRAQASSIPPEYLESLRIYITGIAEHYEYLDPQMFSPSIVAQQRLAGSLLDRVAPPNERRELFAMLGYLAELHANVAFDRGDFSTAEQMGKEALELSRLCGSSNLKNLALANLCLLFLYTGRFRECRDISLNASPDSAPFYTYNLNLRARALARLNERRSAEQAVLESYDVMDRLSIEEQGNPGFSLSTYNRIDLDCETVTVYSRLGKPALAVSLGETTCASVDKLDKSGVRAQVRFPLAESQLRSGDAEAAIESIIEAKVITRGRRAWWFESRLAGFEVVAGRLLDPWKYRDAMERINSIE